MAKAGGFGAADTAGNNQATVSGLPMSWSVDRQAPSYTLAAATASPTNVTALSFTLTAQSGETLDCATLSTASGTDLTVTNGSSTFGTITGTGTNICTIPVASTIASDTTGTTSLTTSASFSVADQAGNATTTIAAGAPASIIVDRLAPAGAIDTPAANQPLAGDVAISGSATDSSTFLDYQLDYGAGNTPTSWTHIGTYTSPVTSGTLETWSTAGLSGAYTLRLTVDDAAGNIPAVVTRLVYLENGRQGDEAFLTRVPFDLGGGYRAAVGVANGELTLARDLFSIPAYGPPAQLSLRYSSTESGIAGAFGLGWSSNLTQYLSFEDGFVVWHRADGGRVPFGQVAGVWTALPGHFETLGTGSGVYTITLKDQTTLTFENSGAGHLTQIEDRFGQALSLAWTSSTLTATDASGRVNTLSLDGSGRVTDATDAAGRVWGFGPYDSAGALTQITDPLGNVTSLGYDGTTHLLTSISRERTPASGPTETITWSFGYADGTVTSVTDPVNSSVADTFTYDTASTEVGLLKTYSPLVRNTWTYAYDDLGRVTSTLDPLGFTTSQTFDAGSNLLAITRPIDGSTSATTTYTYDARGNVLSETAPLDASTDVITVMSYSATNDLLTRSEADNDSTVKLITLYSFDGAGQLTGVDVNCTTSGTMPPSVASSCTGAGTENAATNLHTTYTYTGHHQLETETDPLGTVTKHIYDASGNETSSVANYVSGSGSTASQNVITASAFDAGTVAGNAGLPTSQTDPLGNVTSYAYDALGRMTSEALPGDASIPALTRTTSYDEFGNVLTGTEAWTGVSRTTTHVYDKLGRETSVTDPIGVVSTNAYDAAGDPVSTTANGVTTTRDFDGLGRGVSETTSGATTTHAFDAQGRETSVTDPAGTNTERLYDRAGRLLSETVDHAGLALVTEHTYDALGREVSTTDPASLVTTTTYDRNGRTLMMTVGDNATTTAYDRGGDPLTQTSPQGIVTTTQYDALGRATAIIVNDVANPSGPADDVTTTTYFDAAGHTIAVTDPRGISSRTIVNVRGLTEQIITDCTDSGTSPTTDPANCTGTGTHNPRTNVVSTLSYDGSGAVTIQIVDQGTGVNATTSFAYDAGGRQLAVKDPLGTVMRTLYDSAGRLSGTIVNCTEDTSTPAPPSGSWWTCDGSTLHDGTWNLSTSYVYDARGNRTGETAPNGRVTTSVYDDANRLVARIENDVAGTPTAPDQDLATYFYYDDAGRQVAVKAPTVDRTTFSVTRSIYDDAGRLTSMIRGCTDSAKTPPTNPATCAGTGTVDFETNLTTSYAYDAQGRRIAVTAPDPAATSSAATATVTTQSAYDADGRLCRVVDHTTGGTDLQALADPCTSATQGTGTATDNVATRYTYDGAGHLTSMIDGRGMTTSYSYDENGQMTGLIDPDGHTLVWTYDALGQRLTQVNRTTPASPFTATIVWTYDGAGRVLSRGTDGQVVTYTYDDAGNRLTASGPSGTITTTYDRLGRPLSVADGSDSGATTTYAYGLDTATRSDPSGAYSATLDAFGREVSMTDPIHGTPFIWSYRADGQLATMSAPNGNTTAYAADLVGGAVSATTTGTGDVARAAYAWTRNRAGSQLSEESTISGDPTNGTTTTGYDPLGRLTSAARSGSPTQAYSWQAVPNRATTQSGSDPIITTTYDDANRPTADDGGGAYASDADGRLTLLGGQTLVWDSLGRLLQVNVGTTVIASYTYDALDRLRTITHGGDPTERIRYVGTSTARAAVVNDGTEAVLRRQATSIGGRALFDWTESEQRFFGMNGHGDVTWTADDTGAVSTTLRYDPWGTLTAFTGSSLPDMRFQGSWSDTTTGLSWIISRWYAPSLGRFISEDAVLGDPAQPASHQLYAYGAGDPVGRVDPDGQSWYPAKYGETLRSIAYKFFGTTSKWPTIWNANRNRIRYSSSSIVGLCIYIRDGRLPLCSPTSGVITGGASAKTLTAARTLNTDWWNLTAPGLRSITNQRVGFHESPTIWDRLSYAVNVAQWNLLAESAVGIWGGSLAPAPGPPAVLVRGNRVLPPANAEAITVGQFVFVRASMTVSPGLMSHEYIHVLQYQANGNFLASYLNDGLVGALRDLSQLDATGPSNATEAIGYLWQGWVDAYLAYGEQRPWQIWR
ncbi:MAG: RHS repeat-associated core domain-containing protein [Solirubrobacterales bacterium]